MFWLIVTFAIAALFFVIEFALRTNDIQKLVPRVGYGSVVDENFEADKSNFNICKTRFKFESKDWSKNGFEFRSETINFEAGWRATTDSPKNANRHVYIFGGSTVLCMEVRDSETLTSYLQRELNLNCDLFKVLNRGISGATVGGGLTNFADAEISSNDVVVIYFGVNDAKLNEYCQKGRGVFSLVPGWITVIGFLRIRLKIRLAQWIWLETVCLDVKKQSEISRIRATELMRALDTWESKVITRGATFVAILQPHIWLKQRSEAEIALSNRVAAATYSVLQFQYSAIKEVMKSRKYFRSFELCFEESHETTFTDWVHTNSRGNEIIAKQLAKEVNSFI
ncbi:MAG: SGNH/GDSL hydrolase family protein [Acidimicrobiia bacterium]|nr:SGNH/GDSL hydrolase family protein [Actinomycetota bacterium]NCW84136.1 SGNH/GDSL hydrolase family protein [Acidimicrobiia bacterium]